MARWLSADDVRARHGQPACSATGVLITLKRSIGPRRCLEWGLGCWRPCQETCFADAPMRVSFRSKSQREFSHELDRYFQIGNRHHAVVDADVFIQCVCCRRDMFAARVDVGGYRVWMQVAGERSPRSFSRTAAAMMHRVWMKVEPEVRHHSGVRTVLYDRAGLGQSEPKPGPYSIDNEVAALEQALRQCGVNGPSLGSTFLWWFCKHADGGERSPRCWHRLCRCKSSGFFDDGEVKRIQAVYTPQFGALQRAKPELARVMIPLMQAYPETANAVRSVNIPLTLRSSTSSPKRPGWIRRRKSPR